MSGGFEISGTPGGGAAAEHVAEETARRSEVHDAISHAFDAQNIPLTPELIMSFVRNRLSEMDRQIRTAVLEVEGTHSAANDLSNQIQALQDLETLLRGSGDVSDGKYDMRVLNDGDSNAIATEFGLDRSGDDEAIGAEFIREVNDRYPGLDAQGHDNQMDLSCIQSQIDTLQEELRQLNSGNEMKMMHLQNLMQQRSQTLQAGSNFLASIHDGAKTIVGNLR
jgi:hypothetical protein